MGDQQQLYRLRELETEREYNPFPFDTPPDILQLQHDTIDVVEGRVDLRSFPEDYQKKIIGYYRFTPVLHQTSKMQNAAPRTKDTLDAI